jgi:beta-lactamase regulating signal transducer with metallopeptidase domain
LKSFFEPFAKVWSAPSIQAFSKQLSINGDDALGGFIELPGKNSALFVESRILTVTLMSLILMTFLLGCWQIYRDLKILLKIKRKSFLIKKNGSCLILLNQTIQVPFSFYFFGNAYIIIPLALIEDREAYRIAVAHELQHHRQGDTKWVYLIWFLRLLCIFNPLIHLWSRWISEVQEFACDETLVDQKKS